MSDLARQMLSLQVLPHAQLPWQVNEGHAALWRVLMSCPPLWQAACTHPCMVLAAARAQRCVVLQMEKQVLEHTLQQVLELQPGGQVPGSCRPPTTSTSEESRPAPATPGTPSNAPIEGQANNPQVCHGCFLPMGVPACHPAYESAHVAAVVNHHTMTVIAGSRGLLSPGTARHVGCAGAWPEIFFLPCVTCVA